MNSSIVMPEAVEDEMDLTGRRQQLVLLYRQRLERLLRLEPSFAVDMSRAEQRQLLSHSVLSTIDALTELGDGTTASQCLREAQRRQGVDEGVAAGAGRRV